MRGKLLKSGLSVAGSLEVYTRALGFRSELRRVHAGHLHNEGPLPYLPHECFALALGPLAPVSGHASPSRVKWLRRVGRGGAGRLAYPEGRSKVRNGTLPI